MILELANKFSNLPPVRQRISELSTILEGYATRKKLREELQITALTPEVKSILIPYLKKLENLGASKKDALVYLEKITRDYRDRIKIQFDKLLIEYEKIDLNAVKVLRNSIKWIYFESITNAERLTVNQIAFILNPRTFTKGFKILEVPYKEFFEALDNFRPENYVIIELDAKLAIRDLTPILISEVEQPIPSEMLEIKRKSLFKKLKDGIKKTLIIASGFYGYPLGKEADSLLLKALKIPRKLRSFRVVFNSILSKKENIEQAKHPTIKLGIVGLFSLSVMPFSTILSVSSASLTLYYALDNLWTFLYNKNK